MKINENFRSAADKYGEGIARQMLNAGIPDRYVLSACRFHCNPPNKPIDVLSIQFRQWMAYVTAKCRIDVNTLPYEAFNKLINEKMAECICPNPLYDDGKVSVGVFLTKKDAEKYPLKTKTGDDFCTSNACGFNKYTKQGYRLLSIYDKRRSNEDALKYVIATVKNGIISIWNAANCPIGDTSESYMNNAWKYLDSLPDEAQKVIMDFARKTTASPASIKKESKTNKNMKKTFVSESRLKALISESIKHVLNENARDKRVLDFLKSKGYEDYNERMQIIGCLKHDIPNLRLDGNKFLLGACRMFLDEQFRDEQSIRNLDNALKFIHAGNHTEEFDENLNGKSVSELHEMFREASRQMSANDRQRSASRQFNGGSQYRIIPINSYEEAKPYGKYTSWCVTHGKNAFDSYTQSGNRFYFCLKDGFENAPKDDDGAPLNEWGLSMIAVNIDMNGNLTRTTTRYNHDFNGENNPELETTEQLEKVLNVPFYQTFKPYTREKLHARGIIPFDEAQELLDAGTPPEKIFQYVGDFSEGFAAVKLNGKYNFIDKNGKLLYGTWFDYVGDFSEGFAWVRLNDKCNFIDKNGKLLSNTWFDNVGDFSEGCAWVRLNGKWNFIDKNGKLLYGTWFDYVGDFSEGFAAAGLNDKWNYINKNGKLLSDTWFDYVRNFSEGFAAVKLNGKWNFIDKNGKLYNELPTVNEPRFTNGKRIICEMAVVSEDFVLTKPPVASVKTENVKELEGDDFYTYVMSEIGNMSISPYIVTLDDIRTIYSHHCAHRPLKKAAFLALIPVLSENNIIQPWRKKKKKNQEGSLKIDSGMIGSMILIDGIKYLCEVTVHKNAKKEIMPYSITLKDENGVIVNEKKVIDNVNVPDSDNGQSTFEKVHRAQIATSPDTISPSSANITKESKSNKNMKRIISKTQLRQLVAESIKRVLNEDAMQFDYVECLGGGIYKVRVKKNNKWNFIDENGHLLSDTWFDDVFNFCDDGVAVVELNDKWNFIDENGHLLSDTWFDDAHDFSEGFAGVKVNGKWNFIDKNCKLLSNMWFDDVREFFDGIAPVQLNGKWYYIDKNGKLYDKNMKNTIKLNESQLRQMISEAVKETLKEYGGYDSEKRAYGEQDYRPYQKHLDRVGLATGHTRTDAEMAIGDERQKRNGENLDKLRLRQNNNPYHRHLSTLKAADDMKKKSAADLHNAIEK